MNKTLATIGAATLLLGSTAIVQARDTITRQEFEKAAHALEQGVEEGNISKAAARAGIEGLRRAIGEDEKRDRKPAGRQDLEHIEREIRKALAEGKITEEEARRKMQAVVRRRMAASQERVQPKRDAEPDREHSEHENLADQIGERLKQVGARLKEAVANGDLTADEAWAKWDEVKKEHVAPRLEEAVKAGELSEQHAKEIWHAIDRAEVAEKLKAAVAAGDLSEEDARAKWQAYEEQHDR
jgi:polyhydroxyalkanoate synthesis regulator phasin